MFAAIKGTISFLTRREIVGFIVLLSGRLFAGILDLLGILGIGIVASSLATFMSSGDNQKQKIIFLNFEFDALTAKTLPTFMFIILGVFAAKAALALLLTRITATRISKIEARALGVFVFRALGVNLEQLGQNKKEDVLVAAQLGISSAFTHLILSLSTIIIEGAMFIILAGVFLIIDPLATVGLLTFLLGISLVVQYLTGKSVYKVAGIHIKKTQDVASIIENIYATFRELAVSRKMAFFIKEIENLWADGAKALGTQIYLAGMPRYIVETSLFLGVTIFGFYQMASGDIVKSASVTAVFLTGGLKMLSALLPWQNAVIVMRQVPAQAALVYSVLSKRHEKEVPTDSIQAANPTGASEMVFKDVTYSYKNSTAKAISDFDLAIPAGYQVSIIGPSGSGKSTIADLAAGLLSPTSGRIILDGGGLVEKISNNPGQVAYVPQVPQLFNGTLSQNISLSINTSDRDLEKTSQVVAMVDLGDFVASLEAGLETPMSRFERTLSGGQLQRIGLARALFSEPKLLILDEATSSLDADSEKEVVNVLNSMRGKITIIMIAHRLHTVRNSDSVVMMENGKIRDQGTFPELVKKHKDLEKAIQVQDLSQYLA